VKSTTVLTRKVRDPRIGRNGQRNVKSTIENCDAEIHLANGNPPCQRLMTIPGIGPKVATALFAAVGNAAHFGKARDLAAWIGLVPRQDTTGGKPKLLGIGVVAISTCDACLSTVIYTAYVKRTGAFGPHSGQVGFRRTHNRPDRLLRLVKTMRLEIAARGP